MALVLSALLFIVIAGAILLFGYRRYVRPGVIYQTLEKARSASVRRGEENRVHGIARLALLAGQRIPASTAAANRSRRSLLAAGYREPDAVTILQGLKVLLAGAVPLGILLIEAHSRQPVAVRLMFVLVAALAGFRLPDFVVARLIKRRAKLIRRGLPDALDLMVLCSEAGLNVDRAFRSVTQQLWMVHRPLAEELSLVSAEVSAGLRRKEALDNLAVRTQEPEIRKFVAVISQAERFGTSMGDALRTHAEYLRIRRRQEAEEQGAKVGVKMIFPIFLFVMPAIMLVTMGPAVLTISKQFTPLFHGAVR